MTPEPTHQSRCRFGLASADITPPVGIYHRMWGAATHDRSEGVHRPLAATALYFGQPGTATGADTRQVLVALDHCLLGQQEVEAILHRAESKAGIDREALVLTFSHTHAAGLLNRDRTKLPGGELIPDYLESLAETVAELVSAAAETACDADVVYGTGRCDLAAHRDLFDDSTGEYVCGFNPAGEADDTVTIARVTDDQANVLAAIVNYACHPTTLAWDNRLISPDFPGAMRETVSAAIQAPCIFLQGASGELGPVVGFVGDPEVADRNGRQLAYAALSAWESLPPANTSYEYAGKVVSGATIGTWKRAPIDRERLAAIRVWNCHREAVPLRYRPDRPSREQIAERLEEALAQELAAQQQGNASAARQRRALAERHRRMLGRLEGLPAGENFLLEAPMWRMGDAIWLAVQGEPYSLLQRRLRASFPETPICVATLANGWGPSYLPEKQFYGQGIYQESIAWLAAGSLEKLIDVLTSRIKSLLS